MEFNRVSKQELEVISKLAYQIWPSAYASILSKEQIDYMLKRFYSLRSLENQFDQGHYFFVLKDQETIYGFASIEFQKELNQAKLHKLYLQVSSHGKGYGSFMIDQLEQELLENHLDRFCLNVNRYNEKAIAFYKNKGFNIEKIEDIDIGQGYLMEDYHMSKMIK